mmetsp:Transcript_75746/g.153386  ORF Transcript_75746/g.153386 Transcript_75746/m.153386 type:complete len:243 (+) Transcript_75746:726-1454(+)
MFKSQLRKRSRGLNNADMEEDIESRGDSACDGRGDRFRGDTLDAGERGDAARGDAAGDGLPRRRSSGSVPSRGNFSHNLEREMSRRSKRRRHCSKRSFSMSLFWASRSALRRCWRTKSSCSACKRCASLSCSRRSRASARIRSCAPFSTNRSSSSADKKRQRLPLAPRLAALAARLLGLGPRDTPGLRLKASGLIPSRRRPMVSLGLKARVAALSRGDNSAKPLNPARPRLPQLARLPRGEP